MTEMEHQGAQLVTGTEGPVKSPCSDAVDTEYMPGIFTVGRTSEVAQYKEQERTTLVRDNPSSNAEGARVVGDMDSMVGTGMRKEVDLIDWGESAPSAPATSRIGSKPAEANGVADSETVVCEQIPLLDPRLHLMDNDVYNIDFSEPQAGHGDALQTEGVMNGTENVVVAQHQDMSPVVTKLMENMVVAPGGNSHFRSISLLGFSGSKRTEEVKSSEGGSLKDGEKTAVKTYGRALSKVLHGRKKAAEPDAEGEKPVHKPSLTKSEEERQEHKAQKAARKEAEREAERETKSEEERLHKAQKAARKEAEREAEREERELRALANPTPQSMMNKEPDFMKKATKGGSVAKLFLPKGVSKGYRESAVDVRDAKVVMGRRKALLSDLMGPSQAAVALAPIQTAPHYSPKPQDIDFGTVESNQRDVPAWTMEEYMARNARLAEWKKRENDEDYGTIEGNLFGNQFTDGFDDGFDDLDDSN